MTFVFGNSLGFGNSYSLGFGQAEPRGSREEMSLEEFLGKRCFRKRFSRRGVSGRGSREEVSREDVLSGRGALPRGGSPLHPPVFQNEERGGGAPQGELFGFVGGAAGGSPPPPGAHFL